MSGVNRNLIDLMAYLQQTLPDMLEALNNMAPVTRGEWSPAMFGGTTAGTTEHSAAGTVGRYRLIDDVCWFTGRCSWSTSTATGELRISLPFTAANIASLPYSVTLSPPFVTWPAGGSVPHGLILPNTNYMAMRSPVSNADNLVVAVDTNAVVVFTGWYLMAAP